MLRQFPGKRISMNVTDELDKLLHTTLRDSVHAAQPSARVWGRIVDQIKRDETAGRAAPQLELDARRVLSRFDLERSGLHGSGILSNWIRWTQLVHQVR